MPFWSLNQCRELLGRCATEQVLGITTLDVVNEAMTHRMMVAEALAGVSSREYRVRDLRGKMAGNREVDRDTGRRNIGHFWFEHPRADDGRELRLHRAPNYPGTTRAPDHQLATRLIVSRYGRVWDSHLATRDNDFDHVSGNLSVYKPTDI